MADKNLHDIKIDELDSPKKTPLKNILTLLALLFIILVISVVITRLILNTDKGEEIDGNVSNTTISTELNSDESDKNTTASSTASHLATTAATAAATAAAVPVLSSKIPERNLTSVTKAPLRTHTPKKEVKEVKTYKTPKHTGTAPKKSSTTHNTTPKKQYIDKVVVKKSPSTHRSTTTKKTTSSKKAPYLGGKLMPVTNSYYIKVGTYRDTSAIVNKIKKNNFNYSLVKLKNDKTMTRVFVGPFFSENQAERSMPKVKANILSGAYITKVK